MSAFVDTSALLALLDGDEERHTEVVAVWGELLAAREALVTTNYVIVETFAVAQHRLGLAAAEALHSVYVPLLEVAWIEEAMHRAAALALLAARRRRVSLVDHVSFALMRERGLSRAFSLDPHFAEQGFALLPAPAAPSSVAEGR